MCLSLSHINADVIYKTYFDMFYIKCNRLHDKIIRDFLKCNNSKPINSHNKTN